MARQTRERPGRTVALTVVTGFILGGGLFSPLTVRLLGAGRRLGLRFALLPMVADLWRRQRPSRVRSVSHSIYCASTILQILAIHAETPYLDRG